MGFFIAVIVVLAGLNIFFFLIFRGMTLRLGKFAQINVLRQAGVFDDLISKKQEQLENIEAELVRAEEERSEQKEVSVSASGRTPDFLEIKQGLYTDGGFASEYRFIRDNFKPDAESFIRESLSKIAEDGEGEAAEGARARSERAKAARSILDGITAESAYELATLSSRAQVRILLELLPPAQFELVREYMEAFGEFQSYKFLFWLRDYIFANGDEVTVFTGNPDEDFGDLDRRIVTKRDESICEGIYLLSKGRKYDYSISNREIIG